MADLDDYGEMAREIQDKLLKTPGEGAVEDIDPFYQLRWRWADLSITIESPSFAVYEEPLFIHPEQQSDSDSEEPVYTIVDYGNKLATSKGEEMFSSGMSMFKLYSTIEKMVYLLVEKLKAEGIDTETEVQVSIDGFKSAECKVFESIINLGLNVVVINFNPDAWGEKFLAIVKNLADKGYGYPPESPRLRYRFSPKSKTAPKT